MSFPQTRPPSHCDHGTRRSPANEIRQDPVKDGEGSGSRHFGEEISATITTHQIGGSLPPLRPSPEHQTSMKKNPVQLAKGNCTHLQSASRHLTAWNILLDIQLRGAESFSMVPSQLAVLLLVRQNQDTMDVHLNPIIHPRLVPPELFHRVVVGAIKAVGNQNHDLEQGGGARTMGITYLPNHNAANQCHIGERSRTANVTAVTNHVFGFTRYLLSFWILVDIITDTVFFCTKKLGLSYTKIVVFFLALNFMFALFQVTALALLAAPGDTSALCLVLMQPFFGGACMYRSSGDNRSYEGKNPNGCLHFCLGGIPPATRASHGDVGGTLLWDWYHNIVPLSGNSNACTSLYGRTQGGISLSGNR